MQKYILGSRSSNASKGRHMPCYEGERYNNKINGGGPCLSFFFITNEIIILFFNGGGGSHLHLFLSSS